MIAFEIPGTASIHSFRRKEIGNGLRLKMWLAIGLACLPSMALSGQTAAEADNLMVKQGPKTGGYVVRHWGIADGLPLDRLMRLARTPDGYLWIGTDDLGLSRFDGQDFVHFNPANEENLPGWRISSLSVDDDGRLWICHSAGLSVREGRRFRLVSRNRRSAGLSRKNGTMVLVTPDSDLRQFQDGRWEPAFPDMEETQLSMGVGVQVDSNGRWWGAPPDGRHILELTKEKAVLHEWHAPGNTTEPINFRWVRLPDGALAAVSNRGIFQFVEDHWRLVRSFPEPWPTWLERIDAADCDAEGNIWIGCNQRHVVVATSEGELRRISDETDLGALGIQDLFCDGAGSVWIASLTGLTQLRSAAFSSIHVPGEPQRILSLTRTQNGMFWLCPNNGFLHTLNEGETVPVSSGIFGYLRGYTPALQGGIWALGADDSSLLSHVEHTGPNGRCVVEEVHRFPTEVMGLFESSRHGLWIATADGLYRQATPGRFVKFERPSNDEGTVYMREDSEGRLLIFFPSTLVRVRDDGTWEKLLEVANPATNEGAGLTITPDGAIWIAYRSLRLSCYHGGRWRHFTSADLSLPLSCLGLESDHLGGLWWSTHSEGVYYLDGKAAHELVAGRMSKAHTLQFGLDDGLESLAGDGFLGTPFRDHEGKIWIPTAKGASWIDPSEWRAHAERTEPPHVHLNEVIANGEAIEFEESVGQNLHLPPETARLEFHFSVVELLAPKRAMLRYRLRGYEEQWVDAGQRRVATYAKVPPGSYQLEAQAANQYDHWSPIVTAVAFEIAPFWWQRRTVHVAGLFSIMAVGIIAYKKRTRTLKRRQAMQESFSRRLIASQEAERKRIAGEMHDSLGQNLLILKNSLMLESRRTADNPELQTIFERLAVGVADSLAEVRQISQDLRPHQIDRLGLTVAIQSVIHRVEESTKIHVDSNLENIDGLIPPENEIHVLRIVQEALANAIKHADASAIGVTIGRHPTHLDIEISDDGRGFGPEEAAAQMQRHGGMGLGGMEERARILGARWSCRAAPGEGTRIHLRVPIPSSPKNG